MATLTNLKIKDTYDGLLKTSDNQPIDGTLKNVQDGLGNDLPLQISNTTINFTGAVTGIASGGLVAGTPADSMKSADTLTTNPAVVTGAKSIALGEDAQDLANGEGNIAIGAGSRTVDNPGGGNGVASIAVGTNASAENLGISIGKDSKAGGTSGVNSHCIAIGLEAEAVNGGAIGIGKDTFSRGQNSIALGTNAQVQGFYTGAVAIGFDSLISGGLQTIAIGQNAGATATGAIAIGGGSNTGNRAYATAVNAIAMGNNIVANIPNTLSTKELELQTLGGGITLYSPNGTAYKVTVTDAGALVVV